MHRNYFTLYHAARELHEKIAGGRLDTVCTGEKGHILLTFTLLSGLRLQLDMATGSLLLGIFTREGPGAKGRNSASLMKECEGKTVSGVSISPFDREISILLENDERLVLQIFGMKSNLLLTKENVILDACRQKNELAGNQYPEVSERKGIIRTLEKLALDKSLFLELFESKKKKDTAETVSAVLPGFDRTLARELLRRTGSEADPEALFDSFTNVFYEMLDPVVQVTENDSGGPELTILSGQGKTGRIFDSVLEGLAFYSISMLKFIDTREELKIFRFQLLQRLSKKKKELAAFDPGMIERFFREYETCGHLLIASLGEEGKGRNSITVQNFFEPDAPGKTIELKAALSLRENAGAYFTKAAKTKARLASMTDRQASLEREIAAIEKTIAAMETIESPRDARRFLDSHRATRAAAGKQPAAPPFRSVRISPGATLFIGKNAENNELLTFSHAKPDDIWLHARGASGSHCVLKGSCMDNLDDIKKAASIAAWYSSAKHSELVPVIYTSKKYVRRSKKLAAGQVIVEREKVLFVSPSRESG
jgi:predicted ribosome quality control (RQC) complex YloA/Tae2 family protein